MPSIYFSRKKGLQASSGFLLGPGQNFLSGNTWSLSSQPFSAIGHRIYQVPRCALSVLRDFHTSDRCKAPSVIGTLSRTLSVPSVTGSSCQSCLYNIDNLLSEPNQRFPCSLFQRNIMSACNYLLGRADPGARHLENANSGRKMLNSVIRAEICYGYKGLDYCRRISGSLNKKEPWGTNMVYKCFWSNATGTTWKSYFFLEPGIRDFHSQHTVPYSAGAAPDVSLDGTPREEQLENSAVSSDQKVLADRSLKLLSGSCYLPHPDKEETGGEDAHFICVGEQAVGVADGVGGWADHGVDAGQYARELMSNSVTAIREEPKGSIDPARVLEKAYSSTKARGSSTACIIALTDEGIHAVNLGDSGFIVVRDGCTIFRSPVQQHDFNFTYQLESDNGSDLPSSAQSVAAFFNQVMAAIGGNTAGPGDAVVNVYINHEKMFAFVEMRSVEEASNAMALDGIIFEGAPVKVRRPTDYNPALAATLGPSQPNPNLNLAAVGLTPGSAGVLEGPDRIFVGGIPHFLTEEKIRELLEMFGPLRGFNLVKDRETGNSKGYAFCIYQDLAVTDIACAALNGIKMGDKTLTVRRANQGLTQPRPEQENLLLQAQQQVALQKLAFQMAPLPTKVVCLTEVISVDELKNDEEYEDIVEDMRCEGEKYGKLVNVIIPRPGPNGELSPGVGKVFLEYADTEGSTKARQGMNGRKFGGKEVVAIFYPESKFAQGEYDG